MTEDQLREQVHSLIVERNKYLRFINQYADPGGDCKSCGELTHRSYVCFHCGRDNSYSDEEWAATA